MTRQSRVGSDGEARRMRPYPLSGEPRLQPPVTWVALARELTARVPQWAVWKHGLDVNTGGDLDSLAPVEVGNDVTRAFAAWATAAGMEKVIACRHVVGALVLVACGGTAGARLLQLDVVDRRYVHGAQVWSANTLAPLAELGDDGVRRLPPPAEALARVLADRRDEEAWAMVRAHQPTVHTMAERLGWPFRLAASERRAALALSLVASAAFSPASVVRCAASDRARERCPVVAALRRGRVVPSPLERWLETSRERHEVVDLA